MHTRVGPQYVQAGGQTRIGPHWAGVEHAGSWGVLFLDAVDEAQHQETREPELLIARAVNMTVSGGQFNRVGPPARSLRPVGHTCGWSTATKKSTRARTRLALPPCCGVLGGYGRTQAVDVTAHGVSGVMVLRTHALG